MNRQERRKVERETKKQIEDHSNLLKWFNNWTPAQVEFHRNMVHAITEKSFKDLEKVMDSCYIAAMIQALDINLNQCMDICRIANIHIHEVENFIDKEGEKYYMKVYDEKLRNEIKGFIKGLLKEDHKLNNIEIIKTLGKKYDLANKDFQILCKEAREEIKDSFLKELEAAEKPKLEVIETIQKIKGQFHTYEKTSKGVKAGETMYNDKLVVEVERQALKEQIKASYEEIDQQIKELKERKESLISIEKNKLKEFEEIEQVFNI